MIACTGPGNASIDMAAAQDHGIHVTATRYRSTATVELTWTLIMASARNIIGEAASVRAGGWQTSVGRELHGQVLESSISAASAVRSPVSVPRSVWKSGPGVST